MRHTNTRAAAFALSERAMEVLLREKDAVDGPAPNRGIRPGSSTNGRTGPRHRRIAETVVDTI